MPEICRFYGIVVRIFWRDHGPPHFHAEYGEHEALIGIETLEVLHGSLPPRARGLIMDWAAKHRQELWENWERAAERQTLKKIRPLE